MEKANAVLQKLITDIKEEIKKVKLADIKYRLKKLKIKDQLKKIDIKDRNKYAVGIGIFILLFLAYRYIAPFGASVKYQFTNQDKQVEQIKGLESADEFKKNSDSLLKIPTQIIRKNIVTFNVKLLYKNIDQVGVFLRFKGTPKEIKIGIRGSDKQKYVYKSLYQSLLNPLNFTQAGEISFWQKKPEFKNLSDFAKNIPATGSVGYYMFDPAQLAILTGPQQNTNSSTVVNRTLRGTHTFYVKVTQSPFILKVEKYDANSYAGEDRLLLKVEKYDQLLAEKEIADDGMLTNGGLQLAPQSEQITLDKAESGVYKVTLKDQSQGGDVRIKRIEVNQTGLVFASPVFIVDTAPSTLITSAKNISLQTYHPEGLQTVQLDNQYALIVNRVSTKFDFNLAFYAGSKVAASQEFHALTIPQNDLIISGDGFFVFDKNSYFDLKYANFVDVSSVKSTDSLDFVIAGYRPAVKKDDWYEAFVTFSPKDFKPDGDNLYFSLESPELNTYGGEINVDSLEVSVSKP